HGDGRRAPSRLSQLEGLDNTSLLNQHVHLRRRYARISNRRVIPRTTGEEDSAVRGRASKFRALDRKCCGRPTPCCRVKHIDAVGGLIGITQVGSASNVNRRAQCGETRECVPTWQENTRFGCHVSTVKDVQEGIAPSKICL